MSNSLILQNKAGLKWIFAQEADGYALGSIYIDSKLVESPLKKGLLFLRNLHTGEIRWLRSSTNEQVDSQTARFYGHEIIEDVKFVFHVEVALAKDIQAVQIEYHFTVDQDLSGWEVCFTYHADFDRSWLCHIYPFAEDSKFVNESPLTYVGIPAAFIYREDLSLGLLFGINPNFDYLNPTTWTGHTGFHFMDQVTSPQFRVGGVILSPDTEYIFPLQLIFNAREDPLEMITELVQAWVEFNEFRIDSLYVRTPNEALMLFLQGRRKTSMWKPGIGYQLESGDPESNFVYLGEQPLSAYFEYLIYEMTGDKIWRKRCFEQMDFMIQAQQIDPSHIHYGAMHTAFDLGKREFNSDDRGENVGYKPDINAHMARYMLLTWQRVKEKEGIDRQEWYESSIRAIDWVLRQRNTDGGLPQRVDIETGRKSLSVISGRALPALLTICEITGVSHYCDFSESLERYLRMNAEARFRFTGHHPDLPPDEIEEASIWGAIEYWLNKYERTQKEEYLKHALADAYLSFLWCCPRQLGWVQNPTQLASAEQEHFLQYSIYCYQNRKLECLHKLHKYATDPFFSDLYKRLLQGIFWTQVTDGDQMGATHERIADPWLARADYGEKADFNSMGTVYIGEQSLDTMLQLVEMGQAIVTKKEG
jgi:hypothetical protein